MARMSHSVVFSLAGRLVGAAVNFVFTPFYLRMLGAENYAFVAVWVNLTGLLLAADLGLPTALNREIARNLPQNPRAARDALRGCEMVFLALAAAFMLAAVRGADAVAGFLFADSGLAPARVAHLVRLMALASVVQFVSALYRAALLGQQRHLWMNACDIAFVVLRYGGAVFLLRAAAAAPDDSPLAGRSLELFFGWMAAAAALQTALFAAGAWGFLPGKGGAVRRESLASLGRVSAGLFLFGLVNVALVSGSRVLLKRWLGEIDFTLHALAALPTLALVYLSGAWYNVGFPRMSQRAAHGGEEALRADYARATRLSAATIWPVALTLAAFSPEILGAWTGESRLAPAAAGAMVFLSLGQALNALLFLVYALAFARGRIAGAVWLNSAMLALYLPALRAGALDGGAAGAAAVYLALNFLLWVLVPLWAHRICLPAAAGTAGGWGGWFMSAGGRPLLYALAPTLALRLIFPTDWGRWTTLAAVAAAGALIGAATLFGAARGDLRAFFAARRGAS